MLKHGLEAGFLTGMYLLIFALIIIGLKVYFDNKYNFDNPLKIKKALIIIFQVVLPITCGYVLLDFAIYGVRLRGMEAFIFSMVLFFGVVVVPLMWLHKLLKPFGGSFRKDVYPLLKSGLTSKRDKVKDTTNKYWE